jgi:hypothetical protein
MSNALLNDARDSAQGLIDRLGVGKYLGDVCIEKHDIRSVCVPLRVFASNTLAEIVLVEHVGFSVFLGAFFIVFPFAACGCHRANQKQPVVGGIEQRGLCGG